MKTIRRLLFFIVAISLLIACSKSDRFTNSVQDFGLKNKMIFIPGDVLTFTGDTWYKYVQVIGNNVLAEMSCPNEVKITFLEDQKLELLITESGGCGGRTFSAYGQMTPSGSVYFEYAIPIMTLPDGTKLNITDVIQGHLGCTIHGPGIDRGTIVFQGKFDGSTLVAVSHFNSKCDVTWPNNNIFPTPVNGPVQCSWTYDLTVE
ncbi:MAG: hypothetical protein IQL11_05245 [Bacteroidales bacterium]|nr:hypothetical protein [Bacteroidales bacterium]